MNKKNNVIIANWLGEVSFETTRNKIDEFNDYFESEEELQLSEENNFNIDSYGMLFEEPYTTLEPSGKFVVISKYSIYDEHLQEGYLFEFINCDCPAEIEKYLYDDWIFVDEFQELVKYIDNKYEEVNEIIDENNYEIDNAGTGCLRFSDFNFKEFLDIIEAKEPKVL